MANQQAKELFLHELGDVLTAERTIAKMIPALRREVSNEKLSTRFNEHLEETRQHVKNVEQVFKALGARAKAERCPAIEGIQAELAESPKPSSPELKDLAVLAVASRVEHYEISAYEGLITMARAMGQKDVVQLLERNLKEEQAMLRDGKAVTRQLAGRATKDDQPTDGGSRSGGRSPARAGSRASSRASSSGGSSGGRASRSASSGRSRKK